ncbi:ethyl tert-butyl ether degradation EthD [Nostoc sp. NIES-4103]|nr:ethyl tert-butyl ether degradation EthD [Nostoc sp. NIES-4103]
MIHEKMYKNAVLDDKELQEGLKGINPKFGDFVTRVAGEAWGLPLISQKTKALITIAVDVANQDHVGSGNPFLAHVNMALQQGATYAEIEELLLFMCVYAGFNKVAGCFGTLNQIIEQSRVGQMISAIRKPDYAIRDQKGKFVFYVLLWKKKGIKLELFSNYWKNVHGPVCARLPGQHQYWQFHLSHNQGALWPVIDGIDYNSQPEDQFDGIAELTFETESDRQTWFQAATVLMDDEHNLFRKAIGYNTSFGNSKTYIDAISTGDPNGELSILKFHVMVKKSDDVSVEEFRKYMTDSFASAIVKNDLVLKFRLHLFEEVDNSRPDAAGVVHYEPQQQQYQAAFEIAFSNPLEMETFFASKEYAAAIKEQAKYVKQINSFAERNVYTFVYNGQMTLAGQRSSRVAELIAKVGATNQLQENIVSLMNGKQNVSHYLQEPNKVQEESNMSNGISIPVSNGKAEPAIANLNQATSERLPGTTTDLVKRLFARGEAFDAEGFVTFFTDTPVYQFGNFEPSFDKPAIQKSVANFFSQISAIYHDIKTIQEIQDVVFVEMDVVYWRKDGSVVTLPCFDIFRVEGDKFSELRIFMDINPLFNPTIFVPPIASVFTISQGKKLPSSDIMRKHFAEHPEAKQRIAAGFIPKWAIAGPKWPIDQQQEKSSEQLDAVVQLSGFVLKEDWEQAKQYLTDDVYYKVGSSEPVYGKQAVVDYLSTLFATTAKFVGHEVRKIWHEPGVVVVEMDAKYVTVKDQRHLTIACCDIYRLRGNQVSEWRVYVDLLPFFETPAQEQQPQTNGNGNKYVSSVGLR